MLNVCSKCGQYRADKVIDPTGPTAICPVCSHGHHFLLMPLLIVGGASGSGKSAVCNHLTGQFQDAVLLDCDILWREEFNTPENNYRDFFETWLRLCKNISQSGRPVVLFGAGFGVPENLAGCIEKRYFSEIHYLALVCSDEDLAKRLRQRAAWRETSSQEFIDENVRFNQWFKNYANRGNQPPITLLDTGRVSLVASANEVVAWIQNHI